MLASRALAGLALVGLAAAFFEVNPLENRLPEFIEGDLFSEEGMHEDGAVSMLELGTGAVFDRCHSNGDTHVGAFSDISPRNYDVMGQKEWVMAEGPDEPFTPKWVVQTFQTPWQQCGTANVFITCIKDVAVKCGNATILMHSYPDTHGCGGSSTRVVNPELYVKGTNAQTKRDYDGRNYLKDPDFAPGSKVELKNGLGGVATLKVTRSTCFTTDCKANNVHDPLSLTFDCAGTTTAIGVIQRSGWNGGGFVNMNTQVPKNDPNALIRTGTETVRNLKGGYCGGWAKSVWDNMKTQMNTCRGVSPRPFYDNNNACQSYFLVKPADSLFAAFEHWSHGAFDSIHSADAAKAASNTVTDWDQARYDENKANCKLLAKKYTPVPYADTPGNPKEMNVKTQVDECAEDGYFGMDWDDVLMKNEFCDVVAFKVMQERKDIFCAATKLENECTEVNPTDAFKAQLKAMQTPASVQALRDSNADLRSKAVEVRSSTEGIAYWREDACLELIPDNDDLRNLDCDNWGFVDTSKDMTKEGFVSQWKHVQTGIELNTNHLGSKLFIEKGNQDPVIFVGAPEFRGPNPAAARVKRYGKEYFTVFLSEPPCFDHWHTKEQLPYLIMDANYNYGDGFKIFRKTLGRDFVRIEFGRDMGPNVRVFATVQSSNNNACDNCPNEGPSPNGFVVVRMRNLNANSVEVRLQLDKGSEESNAHIDDEEVALLVVKEASGELRDLKFLSGSMATATSNAGTNRAKPSTVQSITLTAFNSMPMVLTQVVTSNGGNPVMLRSQRMTTSYQYIVDEDGCGSDARRNHKGETVHWLAVEILPTK